MRSETAPRIAAALGVVERSGAAPRIAAAQKFLRQAWPKTAAVRTKILDI